MFFVGYSRTDFDGYIASQFGVPTNIAEKYPQSLASISSNVASNYKWLSATLYTAIYIVISVVILFILFYSKKIIRSILYIYFGLCLICLLLIVVGNWFDSYKFGYGLAQNIKNVMQSPILTFFFIIYFWKIHNPSKVSK